MNPESEQSKWIMQYLLGDLSEEEQSRLEERYFADPDFFQEVRASRDDLIDAYLRGELSSDDRARFEKYFMATPRRRERVEFARTLVKTVDQTQEPTKLKSARKTSGLWQSLMISLIPYRRPIIALGLVVIIFAGGWFLMRSQRGRTIKEAERASQPPNQNGPGAVETPMVSPNETNPVIANKPATTPHAPSPRPEAKVVTFALSTGLVRDSAETKILAISKNVELVQLALEVERDDDRGYRAVLNTPEGQELWRAEIKNEHSKRGSTVLLRVPASIFKNADYILSLSASTNEDKIVDVGKYYFRVHRK